MMIGAHEAARRLGVTPSALRKSRARGTGPAYEWQDGRALYDEAVIAAYVHQPRKPGRPMGAKDSRPRKRRGDVWHALHGAEPDATGETSSEAFGRALRDEWPCE